MRKILSVLLILLLLCQGCIPSPEYAPEPLSGPEEHEPAPSPSAEPETGRAAGTSGGGLPPEPGLEPSPSPEPEPLVIKLQFAGDILLHANPVRFASVGEGIYDFKPYLEAIRPYIDGDLAICNMETPVDAFGGNRQLAGYPRFNVPFEILEALEYAGFNHLITANNHAFDKGLSGLERTLENIRGAGFTSTGTYMNEEEFNTQTILDVNGLQVGVVAYSYSVNGLESLVPADKRPYVIRLFNHGNLNDLPRMEADIARLREAGAELVIVSLHWGAEYVDSPTRTQERIARALCEAGADIILGGHSHSPQPLEWYDRESDGGRSLIMYSLGNFLADQLAKQTPIYKTQYGMLVSLYVTKELDGTVALGECTVLPTLFYRRRGPIPPEGATYSLIPLKHEIFDGAMPAFMPNEDAWIWGREAFEHVYNIVGAEFIPGG